MNATTRPTNCGNKKWCETHHGNRRLGPCSVAAAVVPQSGKTAGFVVVEYDPRTGWSGTYRLRRDGQHWSAPQRLPSRPTVDWKPATDWARAFRDELKSTTPARHRPITA